MGIDDVDKRFEPKKPALIRLECENCGQSPDDVQSLRPTWFTNHENVCLCVACSQLQWPTAPALVAQRNAALDAAGYRIVSSTMACLAGGLLLVQW
jgi:hypothetical protein